MKKFGKFLVILVISVAGFVTLSPGKSEAAWSSWQGVSGKPSSCKVRVWTDASTYTSRATSVDAQIQQQGSCGTLYYDAYVLFWGSSSTIHYSVSPVLTGYFSSITPTKVFKTANFKWLGDGNGKLWSHKVQVDLYSNSSKTNRLSSAYSDIINIYVP